MAWGKVTMQASTAAAFSSTGGWMMAHGPWIERMIEEGHEIGSHSWSHPRLTKETAAEIERQIVRPYEKMLEEHGYKIHLFRPPYGASNATVNAISRFYGQEVIRWHQTTKDSFDDVPASKILDLIAKETVPGSIIICHNGAKQMKNYLVPMIEDLTGRGFEIVTVSELMGYTWDDTYTAREQMKAEGTLNWDTSKAYAQ